MNMVFVFFVGGAVIFGALSGRMKEVSDAGFQAAKDAVSLAISLIGIMAFWLGIVRVLEAGGFVNALARVVQPVLRRLFPEVPGDHPAIGAVTMNISANMLGLGNAATPFGIKAMIELNKLNKIRGTATNAMCLFLALHTSSVTLLPLGVIGVRAAAGCAAPAAIFLPTLLATTIAAATGVVAAMWFAMHDRRYADAVAAASLREAQADPAETAETPQQAAPDYSHLLVEPSAAARRVSFLLLAAFWAAVVLQAARAPELLSFLSRELLGFWLMPALMLLVICYGLSRGVRVYEAVVEGAKQGFDVAVRIIPFLVAILVAVAMFRESGAMDLLARAIRPLTDLIFMPVDTIPMALVRPLSGSGAFGVMSAVVKQAPDSYSSFVASVMMGATDTTFYIIAVYFGAVGVTRIRHALAAGLCADVAGTIAACLLSRLFF